MRIPSIDLNRRDFLLNALATPATGLALPNQVWAKNVLDDESEILQIGYLPIADATALLVAHAYGYFEQEGLKVAPPTRVSSWAQLVRYFFIGQFNLVHFLKPIPIWLRYNHKIPVKIMAWAHINGSAIVVGKHTHIQSFSDLAGKQIAVPHWYSVHNILLQLALRHVLLKPVLKHKDEPLAKDEVNLRLLPPPVMPDALMARTIDAYIVAEPLNAKGEWVAGARMLRFTGDIWKNHPCCVVCMNENTVKAKPLFTQKVINAIVRAQVYAQQNKEEVAHTLSQEGKNYIPVSAQVLKHAMLSYDTRTYTGAILHQAAWGNGRIDFSPWPYPSATRFLVKAMKQTLVTSNTTFLKGLDPEFVVKDLVDYHFVKVAMEKYLGWETAPGVDVNNPFGREEIISI
ncbi:MAG: ABC transporter substrate-binding protein [Candidatus Parabeggiatoa sp. nov. 1]|nr:MAG: ABC transporter substrate-binding protein [Gammaproteobacteria bacterium]